MPSFSSNQLSIPLTVSLRERVRELLLAQIMSGDMLPGEIYSVPQLAAELQVSPTPIREAVLDLANSDLLIVYRNRGFAVPPIRPGELEELDKIRILLEVPSTVEAGMMLNDRQIDEVEELAKRSVDAAQADDLAQYVDIDHRFHTCLLAPLGMPRLTDLIMQHRDRARLRSMRTKLKSKLITAAAQEHIDLIAAVRKKDAEAISRIITDHVRIAHTLADPSVSE